MKLETWVLEISRSEQLLRLEQNKANEYDIYRILWNKGFSMIMLFGHKICIPNKDKNSQGTFMCKLLGVGVLRGAPRT